MSFFHQSCVDSAFTANQFVEAHLQQNGDTSHVHSNSDEELSAHDVLVTTLPVCSNWVPDAMVDERLVSEVDRRVSDLSDSLLLPRPQASLSVMRSRRLLHVLQVQDGVQGERDAVSRVLLLLLREQEGSYVSLRYLKQSHVADEAIHRSNQRGFPAAACDWTRIVRKGASRAEQARQTRLRVEDPEEGDGGGTESGRTYHQRAEDSRGNRFSLPVPSGVCLPNRRQAVSWNAVHRRWSAVLPSPAGRSLSLLLSSVITSRRSERVSTRRR